MTQREQIIIGPYQIIGVTGEKEIFHIHHIRKTDGIGLNFEGSTDIVGDLTFPLRATLRNRWLSLDEEIGDYQFMTGMDLDNPRESIIAFISNYITNLYIDGRVFADEITIGESDPEQSDLDELDMTLEEYHEIIDTLANEEFELTAMDRHKRTMNWIAFRLKVSPHGLNVLKRLEKRILETFGNVAKDETQITE